MERRERINREIRTTAAWNKDGESGDVMGGGRQREGGISQTSGRK